MSIVCLHSSHDATKTYAKTQLQDVRMLINYMRTFQQSEECGKYVKLLISDRCIVVIANQQKFELINRVKCLVHVSIIDICPNIQG